MTGAVSGANPDAFQHNIQNTKETGDKVAAAKNALTDSLNNLSEEMKAPSTKDVIGQQGTQQHQQSTKADAERSPIDTALLAQFVSSELTKEEIEKKKKARRKLDDKMKELAALSGQINLDEMDEDDKEVLEEMFQNINTIKNLEGNINRLDRERDYLEQLLEKNKD